MNATHVKTCPSCKHETREDLSQSASIPDGKFTSWGVCAECGKPVDFDYAPESGAPAPRTPSPRAGRAPARKSAKRKTTRRST